MRMLARALVLSMVLSAAATPASAAIIGQFSWGGDDLFGPTFTFEGLSPAPTGVDFYLNLLILSQPDGSSDPGLIAFDPEALDDNMDGVPDRFLSQVPLHVDLAG